MDEWERDDDYEYGYDYLYEEEKPTDAAEDADGPDDDAWWNDELDEAVEKRLADAREADMEDCVYMSFSWCIPPKKPVLMVQSSFRLCYA